MWFPVWHRQSAVNMLSSKEVATVFREGIKPGMEWNETESNLCTIQMWRPDMGWKIGVKLQCTGSWSCVLYLPWRQDKYPADSQSSIWNILAVHLVSLSGITGPCSQVRGQRCHYCLWTQPWSVELSVAHPETGREWYIMFKCALCKYEASTTRECPLGCQHLAS